MHDFSHFYDGDDWSWGIFEGPLGDFRTHTSQAPPAIASAKPAKKQRKKSKRRRTQHDQGRVFIPVCSTWTRAPVPERSVLEKGTIFDRYASFLRHLKTHPTVRPNEASAIVALAAFPSKYRSPVQVPKNIQKGLSSCRFFYVRHLVYRPAFGHALYIVPKHIADEGSVLNEFRRHGGLREVFRREPSTGDIHYLGRFCLVNSPAFSYCRRECGSFPELSQAPTPPPRGNSPTAFSFYVLQFVEWNPRVFDAFISA